jgi:hypothetical protein
MAADQHRPSDAVAPDTAADAGSSLAERLERGELICYPLCPFSLPQGDDLLFLREQRLGGRRHKNISYDPATGRVAGFRRRSAGQALRLREVLAAFADAATAWLARVLPRYAAAWERDRATFRPAEEATRRLRLTARNDLLHVDAFPTRPARGRRLLRLFANVNATEPRVWVTSDTFPALLERYGTRVGLPGEAPGWAARLRRGLLGLFHPAAPQRTPCDAFMLRLHDFLKLSEEFQDRARKRLWRFPPGSAWLLFSDGLSHAALRGRFALEHSYFIPPESLALPQLAPAALLSGACLRRAG